MKKLLLFTFLMLAMVANAQDIAQAKEAVDKGDTYTAQKSLQAILKDQPDNAEANYLMAKSYTAKRSYAQSGPYINKAIELDPANVTYRKLRINSLNSASSNQDLKNAIADLHYLIANGDTRAVIYTALASAEKDLANNIYRHTADKTAATYKEAVSHYENAKDAYYKAADADKSNKAKYDYEIQQLESNIKEAKKLII